MGSRRKELVPKIRNAALQHQHIYDGMERVCTSKVRMVANVKWYLGVIGVN